MSGLLTQIEGEWACDYEFQECVGEGHVGQVYRCIDVAGNATRRRTSREVAIKIYRGDAGERMFKREVQLLKSVRGHPNVAELLTSHSLGTKAIVMPFYGEVDLHTHVWRCGGMSESRTASVTRDLLSALQHIHGQGIIHRDVKPENMILKANGSAVLTDFDVACRTYEAAAASEHPCGTLGYIAPEVFVGEPCSFVSDVFSVGCVVYFMFAKVHPFLTRPMTEESVWENNSQCCFAFGTRFGSVSFECRAFISSLVVRDPAQRLSEEQASVHLWLTKEVTMSRARAVETSADEHTWSNVLATDVPSATRAGSKSQTTSRSSRVTTVGRNIVSKFSRALRGWRRKNSTVAPSGDINDVPGGKLVNENEGRYSW